MINDFNADQARANSNQVEQLSRDFILDELLQSAKNMSLAKNNFAS